MKPPIEINCENVEKSSFKSPKDARLLAAKFRERLRTLDGQLVSKCPQAPDNGTGYFRTFILFHHRYFTSSSSPAVR